MKAWKIEGPSELELIETKSKRAVGQIRVKLSTCALSATDLAYYRGTNHRSGIVPSHSAVGFVSEADDESELKLGQRVVISPYIDDSEVEVEIPSQRKIKIMGVDVDGFLSDFVNVPQNNVYVLPEGIKDEEAVFIDYIALANQVIENFDFEKGDYLLIIGASTFGLVIAQLALYYQLVPIIVDKYDDRLKLAEELGVYYTVNFRRDDVDLVLKEITGGRMADFTVFEPRELPFSLAHDYTREGGTVVVSGYNNFVMSFDADIEKIFAKQITIKGVNNGIDEITSAINFLANHVVRTEILVGEVYDFEDAPKAFEDCQHRIKSYGKVLIKTKNM
ncbi:MAG: zinc-binding dehydrogenase [Acidaminococcus sp.]|nr:zinc-binding dehydrogenase [Acidaminococcus sp.]MDD7397991.1 zinc-binding dehydrogenase [Bacillota bacterium]MDY5344955.1 zinc-binding dehydrogenase [Eubacteriales bacterium]